MVNNIIIRSYFFFLNMICVAINCHLVKNPNISDLKFECLLYAEPLWLEDQYSLNITKTIYTF